MLGSMPFSAALGVRVIAATEGSVTLEALLTPAFEAPARAFAASSVGALGDMAIMLSLSAALPLGNAVSDHGFHC